MKYLSLDIRALALMRICIAFVLLLDLSIRISDLEAFYTNMGAVPLSLVFEHTWNNYFTSIHTISGHWIVQFILFMVAYFCAFMLLIGYRTRLFTFFSWFLLLSLHNRNSLILQGGDDLLRMVLFWAMFLPWGAKYSCDSLLDDANRELYVRNPASIAYVLQIVYVYTGSALLKGAEWHTDFTALYYIYSLDQIAYPITRYIYHYPDLMKVLTAIAYYFELLVPALFFIPVKHSFFRLVAFIFIVGFHIFNGLSLLIGLFFVIGIVTAIGLLPSFVMDYIEKVTRRIRPAIVQSFLGIAAPVKYLFKWKRPSYIITPWKENMRDAVLLFLILYVFYWNLANLPWYRYQMSDYLKPIAWVFRLDQSWGMFAPGVFKDDGWYVLEAETADGKKINLLHPDDSLTYAKPANVVATFKNDRWRKYSENYILSVHAPMRGYFCNYYKRRWNDRHPHRRITTLRVIYMMEFTRPNYGYSHPSKEVLFECTE